MDVQKSEGELFVDEFFKVNNLETSGILYKILIICIEQWDRIYREFSHDNNKINHMKNGIEIILEKSRNENNIDISLIFDRYPTV